MGKQLLYMYIDQFYGFQNQGFNFSSSERFGVLYGTKPLILRREEYEKPLKKGFFGNHILDVSVLIGNNGSGKTTLMKIICQWICFLSEGRLPQEKGVLVFRQDDRIRYIGFEKGNTLEIDAQIPEAEKFSVSELKGFFENLQLLYYSNTMTGLSVKNDDMLLDYSLTRRIIKAAEDGTLSGEAIIENYHREEFNKQVDTALKEHIEDFPMHYLQMEVCHLEFDTIKKHLPFEMYGILLNLSNLWNYYFKRHQQQKVSNQQLLAVELLKALLIGTIRSILQYDDRERDSVKALKRVVNFYNGSCREPGIEEGMGVVKQFLIDLVLDTGIGEKNEKKKQAIVRFVSILQSDFQNSDPQVVSPWKCDFEKDGKSIVQINIESDNRTRFTSFWEAYKKVGAYMEQVGFSWVASSGEQNWTSLFSILADVLGENVWLFLDEPDNTLHPDWQRKLLEKIIKTCNGENYFGKSAQLFISTHSPIMLSDTPGNSVIYLEEKENIGCQLDNTFGQNIYALFNDAFFLREGVVGTFASSKISEVLITLQKIEKGLLGGDLDSKKIGQLDSDLNDCEELAGLLGEPLMKGYIRDSVEKFKKWIERKIARKENNYD